MHYYTFNIGDYRKDTGHLNTLEHGIYRQLLDWYYLDEKPIPKETETVIRRLRLGSASDIEALNSVLADFFVLHDDGYHQSHCDDAIAKYHAKAEVNKVNGKKGGRPKKTQSVIFGNPNESEPKGNQQPITNNQQPNKETPSRKRDSLFDSFWQTYPKKVGKDAARKAFEKRKPDNILLECMLKAVRQQQMSDQWAKGFIPNPATWLNEGRWQDEVSTEPLLALQSTNFLGGI